MEFIHLTGAEQVQSAGVAMQGAAETMMRAANYLQETLAAHQVFMEEWMQRFEAALEAKEPPDAQDA